MLLEGQERSVACVGKKSSGASGYESSNWKHRVSEEAFSMFQVVLLLIGDAIDGIERDRLLRICRLGCARASFVDELLTFGGQ